MSRISRDRLGSLLMLVFIASLWVQRDYTSPFGGMFPDTIMRLMAAFIALSLVLSFTRYAGMPNEVGVSTAPADPNGHHIRDVIVIIIVLALWVTLYRVVGFAITGILGFAAIAWYLGDHENGPRDMLKAISFGALVSFVIYMIFDYFLLVPLPPGFLFN